MDSCQQSPSQPYYLVCPHCHRVYTDKSRAHYEKHIISCQLAKPFHCDKCDACFLHAHVLRRHQRTHTNQAGCRCPICGKTCSDRFRLREHISTHNSPEVREKARFKCTQCDKSFLFKASLSRHYHTHIDKPMYKCTGCLKEFFQYQIMYRHRKGCEQFIKLTDVIMDESKKKMSIKRSERGKMSVSKKGVVTRGYGKKVVMKNLIKKQVHVIPKRHISKNNKQMILMPLHSQHIVNRYNNVKKTNLLSMFKKTSLLKAKHFLQEKARFEHVMSRRLEKSHLGEQKRRGDKDKKRGCDIENKGGCDESSCTESSTSLSSTGRNYEQTKPLRQEDDRVNNPGTSNWINVKSNVKQKEKPGRVNVEQRMSKRRIRVKIDKDFDYGKYHKQLKKHQTTVNKNVGSSLKVTITVSEDDHETTSHELSHNYEMEDNPVNLVSIIQVVCPHCKYVCQAIDVLKDHIRKVHKGFEANNIVLNDVMFTNARNNHQNIFPCLECQVTFPKHEELCKHKIEKHNSSVPIVKQPETGKKKQNMLVPKVPAIRKPENGNKTKIKVEKQKSNKEQLIEAVSFTKSLEVKTPSETNKRNLKSEKQTTNSDCSDEFFDSEDDIFKGDTARYECTTCSTMFVHRTPLRQHKKTAHNQQLIYSCSVCDSQYSVFSVYKTHLRLAHSNQQYVKLEMLETRIFCDKLNNEQFYLDICTACGEMLSSNRSTGYEHNCIPSQARYYCPYCKHTGYDYPTVQEHIAELHPERRQTSGMKHKNLNFQHVMPDVQLDPTSGDNATDDKMAGLNDADPRDTTCKKCDRRFSSVKEMLSHATVHSGIRPFVCGLCGFSYTRLSAIKKHKATHCLDQEDKQHVCQLCSKRFAQRFELRLHERTHTGDRPHMCDVCGNRYSVEKSVKKHIQLKHPDLFATRYPQDVRISGGQKQCEQCEMVVWNRDLNRHYATEHSTLFVCEKCGQKYKTERQLKRHMSKQHSQCKPVVEQLKMISEKPPASPDASSDLKDVFKVQFSYENYKVKDEHETDKPWKCTLCGEKFRKSKFINAHLRRIHTVETDKPFSCPFCKRGFLRINEMKVHLRKHTNYRPYKCRLCKKSFKQAGHINDHMRTHTTKCVTSCRICGQQFKMAGNIGSHVRSHCKLRPYKCILCDEDFIDLRRLITHSGKCLAERNYINETHTCHMCHQEFSSAELACNHLVHHKTDRPFACEKCQEPFHGYFQLYKHKIKAEHFSPNDMVKTAVPNRSVQNVIEQYDMDLEVLLKQYDYIPADNFDYETVQVGPKAVKSSRRQTSNDTYLSDGVLEKQTIPVSECIDRYTDEQPGGDEEKTLILVAQQLTHMGDVGHARVTGTGANHTSDLGKHEGHQEQLASMWETEVVVSASGHQFPAYVRDIQPEINAEGDHQIVVTTQGSYELTGETCFDQCESIEELQQVIVYTEEPIADSADMNQVTHIQVLKEEVNNM